MSSSILGSAGKIWSSRSSNKVTIPPSSRLLFLAFLGISALLGGLLLSQFVPGSYVFGVLALVAACGTALIRWPEGGLLVIVVASVMPRVSVEIGGRVPAAELSQLCPDVPRTKADFAVGFAYQPGDNALFSNPFFCQG